MQQLTSFKDGMLLSPLCTQEDYCRLADQACLKILSTPFDISDKVSKTWSIPHLELPFLRADGY